MDYLSINRFNELPQSISDGVSESLVDEKIRNLQNGFNSGAKTMFKQIEDKLMGHLKTTDSLVNSISISGNYLSVKGRRIVNTAKPIDKNDVAIKEDLLELEKLIKNAIKTTKHIVPKKSTTTNTADVLEIQNHKRISGVGKAIEANDVVVKLQLDELVNKILELETRYKTLKENARESINDLYDSLPKNN